MIFQLLRFRYDKSYPCCSFNWEKCLDFKMVLCNRLMFFFCEGMSQPHLLMQPVTKIHEHDISISVLFQASSMNESPNEIWIPNYIGTYKKCLLISLEWYKSALECHLLNNVLSHVKPSSEPWAVYHCSHSVVNTSQMLCQYLFFRNLVLFIFCSAPPFWCYFKQAQWMNHQMKYGPQIILVHIRNVYSPH